MPSSMRYRLSPHNRSSSVDYAWSGALTDLGCYHDDYKPFAHCDAKSIYNTNLVYREEQTNAAKDNAEIPGLLKQVDLLNQDVKAGNVHVGPKTIDVIWAGANDLKNAFYQILSGGPARWKGAEKILYGAAFNVYAAGYELAEYNP